MFDIHTQLPINILHNLLDAIYFNFVFLPDLSKLYNDKIGFGSWITMKSTTGTTTTISMYRTSITNNILHVRPVGNIFTHQGRLHDFTSLNKSIGIPSYMVSTYNYQATIPIPFHQITNVPRFDTTDDYIKTSGS